MASKLYFKYGTMNSSKSANLLMVRHNYIEQGFMVWCGKPECDTRDGKGIIATRAGVENAKCYTIKSTDTIGLDNQSNIVINADVVLIDEAQFLTKQQVDDLFQVSLTKPVLCFGLLTNFKQELFEGSKRLIELAESLEKLKTVCNCGKAANYTIQVNEKGQRVIDGPIIKIGGNEAYKAVCKNCLLQYPIGRYI